MCFSCLGKLLDELLLTKALWSCTSGILQMGTLQIGRIALRCNVTTFHPVLEVTYWLVYVAGSVDINLTPFEAEVHKVFGMLPCTRYQTPVCKRGEL